MICDRNASWDAENEFEYASNFDAELIYEFNSGRHTSVSHESSPSATPVSHELDLGLEIWPYVCDVLNRGESSVTALPVVNY